MEKPFDAGDFTIDDRFFSLRFLCYELEPISESGESSDSAPMHAALARARAWSRKFEQWLDETGRALEKIKDLDELLDADLP